MLLTILAVRAWDAWRSPPLSLWHTEVPDELDARAIDAADWPAWIDAEARLFEHVDVLLTPGAPGPAPAGMATGDPVMQAPWTLADFPTMTLPLGLGANGLPVGIQLSAAPLHEGLLLEVAKGVEETIGFREKPPL